MTEKSTFIFLRTDSTNKDTCLKALGRVSEKDVVIADTNYPNADDALLKLLYAVIVWIQYKQPDSDTLAENENLMDIYGTLDDLISKIQEYKKHHCI